MEASSPARLYCLLVGGVLVIAGIIGFFYSASFAVGEEIKSDEVFNLLAVNAWHNIVHIAIGALLLIAAGGMARSGALFVGVLYLVLAALGFVATGDGGIGFVAENGVLLDLVPVNDEDNILHVVLGITGVLAGLASKPAAGPAPAAA
jgi:hypothetical protein